MGNSDAAGRFLCGGTSTDRKRIAGRPFVPADFAEHIFAAIAIDVAKSETVAAPFDAQDERLQRECAVGAFLNRQISSGSVFT